LRDRRESSSPATNFMPAVETHSGDGAAVLDQTVLTTFETTFLGGELTSMFWTSEIDAATRGVSLVTFSAPIGIKSMVRVCQGARVAAHIGRRADRGTALRQRLRVQDSASNGRNAHRQDGGLKLRGSVHWRQVLHGSTEHSEPGAWAVTDGHFRMRSEPGSCSWRTAWHLVANMGRLAQMHHDAVSGHDRRIQTASVFGVGVMASKALLATAQAPPVIPIVRARPHFEYDAAAAITVPVITAAVASIAEGPGGLSRGLH
jgi:hypothetical protein